MVFKTEKFKAANNILIVHLSACDLLLCISFLIYSSAVYATFAMGWPVYIMDPICKVFMYMLLVSISLRAYTLAWMSIERYRTVVHSTKSDLSAGQMVAILIYMWVVLSIVPAIGIPDIVAIQHTPYICHYQVRERYFNILASVYFLIICYIIPAIIMLYCYTGIIKKCKQISWTTVRPIANRNHNQRLKMRAIKILICISVLFLITGLPLFIGLLLTVYKESNLVNLTTSDHQYLNISSYFVGFLLHISPIYNPAIYFSKKKNNCSVCKCQCY